MASRSRRWIVALVVVVVVVAGLAFAAPRVGPLLELYHDYGAPDAALAVKQRIFAHGEPSVVWDTATPAAVGIDASRLDSLQADLAARGTTAFVLVRDGRLVREWYASEYSPDRFQYTAALAKAMIGSMALLTMASDGLVGLDDKVADHVPAWRQDPWKREATLRQLASHAAGLDNVHFPSPDEADSVLAQVPDWKRQYFEQPENRFQMAIASVPLLFEPGTAHRYSGIGYYALAYTLATVLHEHDGEDLRHYLGRRVYAPLGIPSRAWQISYGTSYPQGDLTLYAIGSGGALTPRAMARVGQTVLDQWDEPRFAALHDPIIARGDARFALPTDGPGTMWHAVPHFGWWGNDFGAWPSLPSDALVGLGANDEAVLVVPSWKLVLVRCGASLSDEHRPPDPEAVLEEKLFAPLAAIVGEPGA